MERKKNKNRYSQMYILQGSILTLFFLEYKAVTEVYELTLCVIHNDQHKCLYVVRSTYNACMQNSITVHTDI
jgi:hypothetical protein